MPRPSIVLHMETNVLWALSPLPRPSPSKVGRAEESSDNALGGGGGGGGGTNIAGIRHKRQSVSHIVTRIVGNCVGVAGDKLVYHLCVDEGDGRRERDNSWRFERYPFVSYCLLHGVHFPHQHTVDIPVYSVDPSAYLGRDNLVAFCYWPTES